MPHFELIIIVVMHQSTVKCCNKPTHITTLPALAQTSPRVRGHTWMDSKSFPLLTRGLKTHFKKQAKNRAGAIKCPLSIFVLKDLMLGSLF